MATTTRSRKKSGRRYGAKASERVERAMHEMKRGELRSGSSGKRVRSRKQAIAIGTYPQAVRSRDEVERELDMWLEDPRTARA